MVSQILNVCLQIIEALIAFYFYESVSRLSNGKIKRFFAVIIGYLIMCVLNLAFDYNVIVNNIALVLFHFAFSHIIYKIKISYSVFYSILFTCLVGISEISVINILTALSGDNTRAFIDDTFTYVLLIVFSKSILFFVLRIIISIINRFESSKKINVAFIIYSFSLLVTIIDFILISYQYDLSNNNKIILSVSSIFLTIAVIITCIVQQQNSQKEKELTELRAIQQKPEIESTYFELLEHQNEELQIFVHDMQKHLYNLYNLSSNSDKSKEYIKNLSIDLSESNKIGKTSNKLLDLIIDKYYYFSLKHNLQFETEIHSSNLSFIADNDLTSIFNNLLDNAVEAAIKSKERKINLSINSFGSMLTIDLTNSCDKAPVLKHDKLISTKQEQGMHGYGFKSITKAVKKYSGDIEWDYNETDKTFNISIIFPQ